MAESAQLFALIASLFKFYWAELSLVSISFCSRRSLQSAGSIIKLSNTLKHYVRSKQSIEKLRQKFITEFLALNEQSSGQG